MVAYVWRIQLRSLTSTRCICPTVSMGETDRFCRWWWYRLWCLEKACWAIKVEKIMRQNPSWVCFEQSCVYLFVFGRTAADTSTLERNGRNDEMDLDVFQFTACCFCWFSCLLHKERLERHTEATPSSPSPSARNGWKCWMKQTNMVRHRGRGETQKMRDAFRLEP